MFSRAFSLGDLGSGIASRRYKNGRGQKHGDGSSHVFLSERQPDLNASEGGVRWCNTVSFNDRRRCSRCTSPSLSTLVTRGS